MQRSSDPTQIMKASGSVSFVVLYTWCGVGLLWGKSLGTEEALCVVILEAAITSEQN